MRYVKYNIRNAKNGPRVTSHESRMNDGSALILTVVLTSLLAMVGVLFVMMARVNQIATSGISESRELDSAIETVIAEISEELVLDVPGVSTANLDYYDYPGSKDEWLASLEPSTDPNRWRQISDVTGYIEKEGWDTQDIEINSNAIIEDHEEIGLDDGDLEEQLADADGDGVADSKWIELDDITSSKGKPIYAAIRIVDNGGMLNVNTAYKFDPTEGRERIDGSTQMQINLAALSQRGANDSLATAADKLQAWRCGTEPNNNLSLYEQNVIWRYGSPSGAYTPFDIGDELKLRNRYIISKTSIDTRISDLWERAFDWEPYVPRNEKDHSITEPNDWFWYVNNSSPDANSYNYRHIATTYNMDRIIDPGGKRMVNVNRINDINDVNSLLYPALSEGLDPCLVDVDKIAAQIAVNLKDYRDSDSEVTSFVPDVNGPTYYGFERPCVYISELAHKFVEVPNPIPTEPNIVYKSYAVELYKPYLADNDPNNWRLVIDGNPIGIDWSLGSRLFHVIRFKDPNNTGDPLLDVPFDDPNDPPDPNHSRFSYDDASYDSHFDANSTIYLERLVDDVNYIVVDSKRVPEPNGGWLAVDDNAHSIQRDITLHKCIRRLWASAAEANTPTLGADNNYWSGEPDMIQAHPANSDFTNVGEIGMIFRRSAYSEGPNTIGPTDTEADVRLNLADFRFQQIFNYLTVFDPSKDGINNDGDGITELKPDGWIDEEDEPYLTPEWKVPGRININTAPWYVLAQLPWMQYQDSNSIPFERAKAICNERDGPSQQGFWNIGELMLVDKMRNLGADGFDQVGFPDLTYGVTGDGAEDDFEERDVIFARISNLVTVRSDVFTAYILVRIGTDGPQKRVIAILDRSNVYSPTDRVKIVAVHPVSDPR